MTIDSLNSSHQYIDLSLYPTNLHCHFETTVHESFKCLLYSWESVPKNSRAYNLPAHLLLNCDLQHAQILPGKQNPIMPAGKCDSK